MENINLIADIDVLEKTAKKKYPVEFAGEGKIYFKIWIVNLLLSIITLGVYSAWAKVRTRRYFYGCTTIDNAAFEYHATPMMILKGRLIAVAFFMISISISYFFPFIDPAVFLILILIAPWVIWCSISFNARMTSYRNIRFGLTGKSTKLYLYLVIIPLTPLFLSLLFVYLSSAFSSAGVELTELGKEAAVGAGLIGASTLYIYLSWPWVQQRTTMHVLNHRSYGQSIFNIQTTARKYYGIYLEIVVLGIFMSIAYFVIALVVSLFAGSLVHSLSTIVTILIMLPLFFLAKAYLQTRIRNYVMQNLSLEKKITFRSELQTLKLVKIYLINTVTILFTLGLAYPWAMIRLNRYKLETITLVSDTDLNDYISHSQSQQNALGEELGEAFDLDLDLGF